jgi:hypothetical protein
MAAGFYDNNGTADQTLTKEWNGASWSIVASPDTSPAQSNMLQGVNCQFAACSGWASPSELVPR